MAVSRVATDCNLTLVLQTGVDPQGNPITKKKTFSNIKTGASHQDVFDVAFALANLQQHGVNSIQRADIGELVNM